MEGQADQARPEGSRRALDGEVLQGQGRCDGKPHKRDIAIPVFGYKNHAAIDCRHGFICGWTVTTAAAYDGAQLKNVVRRPNTGSTVRVDTAYRSKANEAWLEKHGYVQRHVRYGSGFWNAPPLARAAVSLIGRPFGFL